MKHPNAPNRPGCSLDNTTQIVCSGLPVPSGSDFLDVLIVANGVPYRLGEQQTIIKTKDKLIGFHSDTFCPGR